MRLLLAITVMLAAVAGLLWLTFADRQAVHVYRGEHPPRSRPASEPVNLALVLGGGGPRGFAHIGVLKVLEAEGIRPDLIVGSSMGAIVGSAYSRLGKATDLESGLLASAPPWWRDLTLTRRPWFKGDWLEAQLRITLQDARLEDLPLRIFAVATHAEAGEPVAFSHGDAVTAVRASAAVPGLFKRVGIAGQEYFDGDISAPVPVGIARMNGARIVIAVDVMSHPDAMPYEMRDYPELSLSDYYRHAINRNELRQADVVIQPVIGYYIGTGGEDRQRAIAAGEVAARAALPAIRAALGRTAAGTAPVLIDPTANPGVPQKR